MIGIFLVPSTSVFFIRFMNISLVTLVVAKGVSESLDLLNSYISVVHCSGIDFNLVINWCRQI